MEIYLFLNNQYFNYQVEYRKLHRLRNLEIQYTKSNPFSKFKICSSQAQQFNQAYWSNRHLFCATLF